MIDSNALQRDHVRAAFASDRDRLIKYLQQHGRAIPTAQISRDLGMIPGRPGRVAGVFPHSLVLFKHTSKEKTLLDLHPHLWAHVLANFA